MKTNPKRSFPLLLLTFMLLTNSACDKEVIITDHCLGEALPACVQIRAMKIIRYPTERLINPGSSLSGLEVVVEYRLSGTVAEPLVQTKRQDIAVQHLFVRDDFERNDCLTQVMQEHALTIYEKTDSATRLLIDELLFVPILNCTGLPDTIVVENEHTRIELLLDYAW